MNKISALLFAVMFLTVSFQTHAQPWEPIDNKGNRNQTYPHVTEINPDIMAMVNQVDTLNLYNSVAWMQQYVRACDSAEALLTQNWLIEQFEGFGLDVSIHYFPSAINPEDSLEAGSVIALQRGTEFPDEYVIVMSHYDHPDGPGADDNASGTAGVLEIARILSQHSFKRSILYIPTNAEEWGAFGCMYLAEKFAQEDKDILGAFNLDMIGFWPEEEGEITMFTGSYKLSERLFNYYMAVANLYVTDIPTLRYTDGNAWGGDHYQLNRNEYPAIYIGDVEYIDQHPCYHRPCDTIGSGLNSFALAKGFTQAALAAAAELANGWLPPQDFSAVCDGEKIILSWDENPETQSYKLFKDNELLTELNENHYNDFDVEYGVEHEYYVVGVKSDGTESAESNHDKMKNTEALTLPYYNGLEENLDDFIFDSPNWHQSTNSYTGTYSLCNDSTISSNDYVTYADLNWFSIPDTVLNASLYFQLGNSWFDGWDKKMVVMASTDRKTWHKIYGINRHNAWRTECVFLDDFIGEPYVQIRFLIEKLDTEATPYSYHYTYIDDINIDFTHYDAIQEEPAKTVTSLSDFELCPNPADNFVNISTNLKNLYSVGIYNAMGIKMLSIDSFSDGDLNISSLPKGIYFVVIYADGNKVAKRLVIE